MCLTFLELDRRSSMGTSIQSLDRFFLWLALDFPHSIEPETEVKCQTQCEKETHFKCISANKSVRILSLANSNDACFRQGSAFRSSLVLLAIFLGNFRKISIAIVFPKNGIFESYKRRDLSWQPSCLCPQFIYPNWQIVNFLLRGIKTSSFLFSTIIHYFSKLLWTIHDHNRTVVT